MIAIVSCEVTSGSVENGIVKNEKLNLFVPNNGDDGVKYLWADEQQLIRRCVANKPSTDKLPSVILECIHHAEEDNMPLTADLLKTLYAFISEHSEVNVLSVRLNFAFHENDEDVFKAVGIIE